MSGIDDLRVRPAVSADYPAFVRLRAELGVPEDPPALDAWERERMPDTRVFERAGELVAYGYFEVLQSMGYVRNVVVDPAFRNRGIGREVMRALARQLKAAGCTDYCLNVLRSNHAAIRLYESVGMERAYPAASFRLAWDRISQVRDAHDDARTDALLPVVSVLAEHDARIERRFDLPQGLIAARRRRDDVQLLGVVRARDPHAFAGFASFEPRVGGAAPFRAQSAAIARALLERIRALASGCDSDTVLIVIENDPALEQTLIAAGAETVMSLWHYRGAL